MSQAAAARIKAQKEAQAAREDAQQEVATELEQSGALAAGWVASSAKPKEASEEPAQQSQLSAKVQAFLGGRLHPADAEASTETSVQATEDEAGTTEGEAAADEEEEQAEEAGSIVKQEELLKEPEEFTWTDFREKRLGRITAECRYNFQKVAAQLSEEF